MARLFRGTIPIALLVLETACSAGDEITGEGNSEGNGGDGDVLASGGDSMGSGGSLSGDSGSGGGTGDPAVTGGASGGEMPTGTGGEMSQGTGGLSSGEILLHATFEERTPGEYTQEMVEGDFGGAATWNNGLDEGRATIVHEGGGSFLRTTYPAGQYGPANGGVQFKVPLEGQHSELYLAYRVRFGSGFDYVKGGKLPGLVGGTAPTGCIDKSDPDSSNGFSARMMWRTDGRAVQYVYTPDRINDCGDDFRYESGSEDIHFSAGTWHVVQHRIAMNTPGLPDGVLQAWFDGELVVDEQAVVWRRTGAIWQIDTLYFSTFFGGGDSSWAPHSEQQVDFDEFVISTAPISR